MEYKRKTIDRWDILEDYGYGWVVVCSEYTLKEAKQTFRVYVDNPTYGRVGVKIEKHRERLGR